MKDGTTLWTARERPEFPALDGDRQVDVAVVGGGIAGLTTASMLQAQGRRVALLEARAVGRQTTGGSSAKITAQHSLIYRRLTTTFGSDTARTYAHANASALEWLAQRIREFEIDCSFSRQPAYTYTADESRVEELQQEAEAAAGFGLPARFTTGVPLPVSAVGAVVFEEQAQFDPYAYALAEARRLAAGGVEIYEHTRVIDIGTDGPDVRVKTQHGTVTARDAVLATNLPILDRGQYFAKALPIAHLAIAAPFDSDLPGGMFISVDDPTHSLRWHRDSDGQAWLIALGPRFRPGLEDTDEGFRSLEAFVQEHFPIGDVRYRWWNEDFESVDGIPYVGRLTSGDEHLYVATGFSGWGITNSIVAGQILATAIDGRQHEWAPTFDSTRTVPVRALDDLVRGNMPTAKAWLAGRFGSRAPLNLAVLQPGDGEVFEVDGKPVAVSRDAQGSLHAVSAECTHMGCLLGWNRAMATWDCSCHGSSFDCDGQVLRGPAIPNLESVRLDALSDS